MASMQKTNRRFLELLLVIFAACGIAQTQSEPSTQQYLFFVLLKRPPSAPQLSEQESEKLQDEHMRNIRKLHAEHKLLVAGPFTDETPMRGIFVLKADSLEQAEKWVGTDPAIQAGRLAAEVHGPWLVYAGTIQEPATTQGMEQYTLVLLTRGDKWNPGAPAFSDLMKQHSVFLRDMTARGKIAVGGDFSLDDRGSLRGIAIFRVGTVETGKLVGEDPDAKAGLLRVEAHPWITGKGVLASGLPTQ